MVLLFIVFSLMLGSSTFTSLLALAAASMLLSRSIDENRSFIIIERDAGGGYDDLLRDEEAVAVDRSCSTQSRTRTMHCCQLTYRMIFHQQIMKHILLQSCAVGNAFLTSNVVKQDLKTNIIKRPKQ